MSSTRPKIPDGTEAAGIRPGASPEQAPKKSSTSDTMKKIKTAVWSLVLVAALAPHLQAIETGEVQGQVRDESGLAIPGVTVTATGPSLQGTRSASTGKNGSFRLMLLPVGTYTLTFSLEGFTTVVQRDVVVRLGMVTALPAVLNLSDIRKEIVVTAPAPLIDKTSTDTSYYLTSKDMDQAPSQNRTVVDAVKFTPGVTGVRVNTRQGQAAEGQPSFRGEGEEGNTWMVDGLSISGVRLKNSGIRLNFDAIDEMQIISDSFSPEFGSSYGGIINMVTKSGGNELHGEASLVFMDKNFQAGRQSQLSIVREPAFFSNYNGYLNLGGPILKDKLWFFISDNIYSNSEQTEDGNLDYLFVPGGTRSRQNNNLFAKLTYAPANNHTLSLSTVFNKSLGQKGGTGIPELYETQDTTDLAFRLNYKGLLNSTTFIEAGLGFVGRDNLKQPLSRDLGPAQYFVDDLAQNIRNTYGRVTDNERRYDFSLKLTKHLDIASFGHHELNLGFEYYSFSSDFETRFSGVDEDLFPGNGFDIGTKYYFTSWQEGQRTPTYFREYGRFDFINSAAGIGLYVKDKITWGRFTVMLGLRSQTQTCYDDAQGVLWTWGLGDFLSPRLSLAVDLTGDGRNVLKLGWGRFSDMLTTMPLGFFNSVAGLSFRTYNWLGSDNPSEAQLHDPANWKFETEQKSQPFDIAQDIKPNFLTRWLIEFDRSLGPGWAVKARYIRSDAERLLEVLLVYDPETSYKFLFDNFRYKRRNYRGLEVELDGKVGDRFFLKASYSFSSAKGTNPGQTETGAWSQSEAGTNNISLFGKHIFIPPLPGLEAIKAYYDYQLGGLGGEGFGDEGWYGKLPYSVDHDLKLNAVYLAPWGVTVSLAFEYLSGYYWQKLGYVPYFGVYFRFPEGRGTRWTPAHSYLDMGLQKTIALSGRMSIGLRLDIFNLLNSQVPVSYVQEDIPLFGSVWGRQNPRSARAMVRFIW
jgi:hypothetical protein